MTPFTRRLCSGLSDPFVFLLFLRVETGTKDSPEQKLNFPLLLDEEKFVREK